MKKLLNTLYITNELCYLSRDRENIVISIDGKEVKIYKANGFFSGILLSPGEHNIELKYFTPGLKIGVLISLIACVSLIVYSIVIKIVNKRKVNV